jgi:hypothetical protein
MPLGRRILEFTGNESFSENNFIQYHLPDYVAEHPDECAGWDVIYDARGHFTEPHTDRSIPLGTLEEREYRAAWARELGPPVSLIFDQMFPTTGPENRFRNVLYIEKEGFDELLSVMRIAERFDLAIMSTKGLSVVASRRLLDALAPYIDRLFLLHDFDLDGFKIAGTLTSDGRRYTYQNSIKVVDLGLRLADVEAMGLQSEPVKSPSLSAKKLAGYGATPEEIDFLLGTDDQKPRRVELNAMTSPQFVEMLERKLTSTASRRWYPDPTSSNSTPAAWSRSVSPRRRWTTSATNSPLPPQPMTLPPTSPIRSAACWPSTPNCLGIWHWQPS